MPLPALDYQTVFILYSSVIASLAVFWSINKAIIIAKSH